LLSSGSFYVEGNVTIGSDAAGGNGVIHFTGSGDQTYTDLGGDEPDGDVTINKTAGTVTLASAAQWNASGQDVTVQSGTLELADGNLTTNNLTIGESGTVSQSGNGNLSVSGNLTVQTGGEYRTSTEFSSSEYYVPSTPRGTLAGSPYRKRIGIPSANIAETLHNFPVYVDLADLGTDFFTNTNCADIKVTTSNGTTEVPREIVSCSTAGNTGELHFLAPEISATSDTDFYIYYGSGGSDYAVTDPLGAQAVWADYAFVSHDGGGLNSVNSQSGGTSGGVVVENENNGILGKATTYDGVDDYTYVDLIPPSEHTITTFVKMKTSPGNFYDNGFNRYTVYTTGDSSDLATTKWSPGSLMAFDTVRTHDARVNKYSNMDYSGDLNWHYLGQRVDVSGNLATVFDGNVRNDAVLTAWNPSFSPTPNNRVVFGANLNGTFPLHGSLDEIRLSSIARSSAWLSAEYANQSSPATFYVVTDVSSSGAVYFEGNEPLTAAALTVGGNVTIESGALWEHKTYGTVLLGGNVANDGTITFKKNTPSYCGGDYVNLSSSSGTVLWSGSGTFNMHNINLASQGGTASIIAYHSLDAGGNDSNWEFYDRCPPPAKMGIGSGTISVGSGVLRIR